MKGHERDPRWSRRRRDTCILWSLGIGALEHGTDGYLSRHQAQSMFEDLDVGASHEQATRLLGANQRASAADLDRLFRVPSTADMHERVSLRGSLPAHR